MTTKYDKFKAAVRRVYKMLAAAAALALVGLAHKVGLTVGSDDIQAIIDFLFVSGAVYVAPANAKDEVRDVLEGDA